MKYYTKEWQKRISDALDNARTLADAARTSYRAEQSKNPVPEEFERKLEFHDAQITSAAMDGDDLHLYFDHPGYNPFEHNHIVFKKARIKTKEHELAGCYFVYYEIYRHFLGYEMHMLLWYHEKNKGFDYADLTVICEDIVTDACPKGQECPRKKKKKK